jgi:hypothetical protein
MAATIETDHQAPRQAATNGRQATPDGTPGATPEAVGEWVGIPDAAERLGLSVDAVRRRIRRKQLRTRRVPTDHGGPARYEVWVEAPRTGAPPGARQAETAGAPGDHQAHQADRQAEALALAQARAHEMATYTEALLSPWRQQVSELSERCGRLEAELEDARRHQAEAEERLAEHQAAARRPWWRFW